MILRIGLLGAKFFGTVEGRRRGIFMDQLCFFTLMSFVHVHKWDILKLQILNHIKYMNPYFQAKRKS